MLNINYTETFTQMLKDPEEVPKEELLIIIIELHNRLVEVEQCIYSFEEPDVAH